MRAPYNPLKGIYRALIPSFPTNLAAEFISPPKVYTFSSLEDYSIPKSVKCAHSATELRASQKIP